MYRIALSLLFAAVSCTAHASQTYEIAFRNDSNHTVWVMAAAGNCMHDWNLPSSYTELPPGGKLGNYTIKDKDQVPCGGSDKTNYWRFAKDKSGSEYIYARFIHTKTKGNWYTYFDSSGNNGSPDFDYYISGADCSGTNCLSPNQYESSGSFGMTLTVSDRK